MRLKQIDVGLRFAYRNKCTCGEAHEVLTQNNDDPEYYTDIFIPCKCGEYVKIVIPVN